MHLRYDHFGDMGHPIDRMAHKFNMTVPGVVGYRPQRAGMGENFSPFEDFREDPNTGSDIRNRYTFNPSINQA